MGRDLDGVKMAEFQQPIRCCNVTAMAYGLTALGFTTTVDEIFYVTRMPIASVLDDGMTLAETYDACVKYVAKAGLPVSVRVQYMDRTGMTFELFAKELDQAVAEEKNVHILNFNASIAHDAKLGEGHFALLADYDSSAQEVTIADTNPRKYTRMWKCPAQRMYQACVDKDSASDRSRGFIVLAKNSQA